MQSLLLQGILLVTYIVCFSISGDGWNRTRDLLSVASNNHEQSEARANSVKKNQDLFSQRFPDFGY
jgi:hypothetical protein